LYRRLKGFYYSLINSIIKVVKVSVVGNVIVLIVRDPEMPKVNIVPVNNASRNGSVLKFILVIQAIEEYLSIFGCHLP
jgi:hypothetical protein